MRRARWRVRRADELEPLHGRDLDDVRLRHKQEHEADRQVLDVLLAIEAHWARSPRLQLRLGRRDDGRTAFLLRARRAAETVAPRIAEPGRGSSAMLNALRCPRRVLRTTKPAPSSGLKQYRHLNTEMPVADSCHGLVGTLSTIRPRRCQPRQGVRRAAQPRLQPPPHYGRRGLAQKCSTIDATVGRRRIRGSSASSRASACHVLVL